MGVAKAALESTSRYLARDLGERGIRVNLVSAGPVKTLAAKGISGFEEIEGEWTRQAPLGWNTTDPEPVGRAVVSLLSDWWPATTGRTHPRRRRLPRNGGPDKIGPYQVSAVRNNGSGAVARREEAADVAGMNTLSDQGKTTVLYARRAREANLVYCSIQASWTLPVGPLRCLPTMTSAMPLSSESEL